MLLLFMNSPRFQPRRAERNKQYLSEMEFSFPAVGRSDISGTAFLEGMTMGLETCQCKTFLPSVPNPKRRRDMFKVNGYHGDHYFLYNFKSLTQ